MISDAVALGRVPAGGCSGEGPGRCRLSESTDEVWPWLGLGLVGIVLRNTRPNGAEMVDVSVFLGRQVGFGFRDVGPADVDRVDTGHTADIWVTDVELKGIDVLDVLLAGISLHVLILLARFKLVSVDFLGAGLTCTGWLEITSPGVRLLVIGPLITVLVGIPTFGI